MAKLYFRYGAMGSAKTLNLLAVAHNYRQQGKQVLILKPAMDSRFGESMVHSRAGLEQPADMLIKGDTRIDFSAMRGISCILVDEAHFISAHVVEQLRHIAAYLEIPVICYGLRVDFRSRLFEGSQRLLELADSIEEVKSTCFFCNRKATMNLRHVNGRATLEGPQVDLGAEDKYFPACYKCYETQLKDAGAR